MRGRLAMNALCGGGLLFGQRKCGAPFCVDPFRRRVRYTGEGRWTGAPACVGKWGAAGVVCTCGGQESKEEMCVGAPHQGEKGCDFGEPQRTASAQEWCGLSDMDGVGVRKGASEDGVRGGWCSEGHARRCSFSAP